MMAVSEHENELYENSTHSFVIITQGSLKTDVTTR